MLFNITFHVGFEFEDGDFKYATVCFKDWSKVFDERYYANNLHILKESVEQQFGKKVKNVVSLSDETVAKMKGKEGSVISFYTEHEKYAKTLESILEELQGTIDNEHIWMLGSDTYEAKNCHMENEARYTALREATKELYNIVNGNIGRFDERELHIINRLIEIYENLPDETETLNVLYSMKAEI